MVLLDIIIVKFAIVSNFKDENFINYQKIYQNVSHGYINLQFSN